MNGTESERVLVVAPLGRDADAARKILGQNGYDSSAFATLREAVESARADGVGLIIVSEEAMSPPQLLALEMLLDAQPPWSDLPLVVLARERDELGAVPPPQELQRFNVTILERPLAVRTLVAATRVALRARRRQYEVRSLLEQRMSLVEREKEARVRAESASRAKDDFLAMLGHELRNPLSPIVTALHIIDQRKPIGIDHELTVLERQVAHLSRLVDDLLDVSRIAQGKVEVKHDPLDLEAVIARAVEMACPLFEQRGHELVIEVAPGLHVLGDLTRLAQVFANLLNNAAKYTPPHGKVTLEATDKGDDVVVRVRDNGIGIAPEMLPRVFDLFAQEKQSLDRSGGGLGLGLAIVRSLVSLHGGQVTASSAGLGKGAELVVRLPARHEVAPPAVKRPVTQPARANSARRVLVVDDNEDAADMLAFAFESSGYATRIAHDGPEALQIAASFEPDVGVLDIGLPVMDGYELARRLKSDPKQGRLKMVALTGYGQPDDVRQAMAAGFEEHLVKPVAIDKLLSTVGRLLSRPPGAVIARTG